MSGYCDCLLAGKFLNSFDRNPAIASLKARTEQIMRQLECCSFRRTLNQRDSERAYGIERPLGQSPSHRMAFGTVFQRFFGYCNWTMELWCTHDRHHPGFRSGLLFTRCCIERIVPESGSCRFSCRKRHRADGSVPRQAVKAGTMFAPAAELNAVYWKSLGAKSFRSRRHVSHS